MARAARKADPLATYIAKRDFRKTAEPAGQVRRAAGNIFMVQKHAATRLHFDFRLELDGVLKSWAVTRGPSLDPEDKRLAVRTEDHPMDYATFEGTIPKGQYGGGTVMLWDQGTWEPIAGKDPRKTLVEGHLHFLLHGKRMKGEWLLVRMKPRAGEKHENWLLRKIEDEFSGGSGDLVDREITSVTTGRTMAEIAEGKKETALSSRRKSGPMDGGSSKKSRTASVGPDFRRDDGRKPKTSTLPAFRPPQLATLVDHVPSGSGWLNEVKYDGYRCLLAVGGGKARAYTRTGQDWSDRFAPIVAAADAIPGSALIDGEIVAFDAKGRPSFQALQSALKEGGALTFFAFDLLEEDGEDLAALPNIQRKERLAASLKGVPPPIVYADHVTGNGEGMFRQLCREGLEGLVSKRADAPYRGRRTQAWLKIKCTNRQEFVIVGWTTSDKGRGFRSLLLGLNEEGGLRYAGKVGTGFDMARIDSLLEELKPLETDKAPVEAPRAATRGAHWVKPKLVAEIAFTEFTADGVLRHPSFVGLREDKPAVEVVSEKPKSEPVLPIKISNPDRVIYPEAGLTKGDLAAYYATVAEPLMAWLADRPVSLVRCPQGRAKHCFFQKHDAGSFGDRVHHVPIREKDGSVEPYLYVKDIEGALTCVQMGTIEFHGWGSKVEKVEYPDRMVFDLDPDEGLDFGAVKRAAVQLHDILAEMGLVSFPMLSGGKGVHVVVPLDASRDWVAVKDFASRFSKALAQAHPDRFTANMKKTERKGRIFLDWLRNQRGATAILPYSARARPNATVAAPITWDELEEVESPGKFTILLGAELVERARSKALRGWGEADQALPEH